LPGSNAKTLSMQQVDNSIGISKDIFIHLLQMKGASPERFLHEMQDGRTLLIQDADKSLARPE